jgi:hypothetical protein
MQKASYTTVSKARLRHACAGAVVFLSMVGILGAAPQRSFATPQEAGQALVDACAHNDTTALLDLFGPAGRDIVVSGDPAEDTQGRAEFARRAGEKLAVEQDKSNPDRATLIVGENDWPFPVPLVRAGGQWRFDAARGRVEILARRIGRNEMNAIEVCRGYVEAQMQYAARDHARDGVLQYAQKIISSSGKTDGLYWEGEPENLVPKSFADAAAALLAVQGKKSVPYHGYYFHILKAQGPEAPGGAADYVVKGKMIGGFALVAWPAEYGVSGVKTLLVNHKGVVYAKDLGANTSSVARQMARFNPDKSWKPVEGE